MEGANGNSHCNGSPPQWAGPTVVVKLKLTLNSSSSGFYLPSAGIPGVSLHTCFLYYPQEQQLLKYLPFIL